MKGRPFWVAVLAALALAGCGGGGEDYPQALVDQFLSSCTAGGASREVCQCALDKIEAKYTVGEFSAEAVKISQGQASEAFTQDVADFSVECQQEAG